MKFKDIYVGIIFIFLLGSLFHFTYEISNNNVIVSIFSSTNESVFEHCKLILYPTIIWYIIYYLKNKPNNKNKLFSSMIIHLITSILSIPILFYTLNGLFGKTKLIIDILIFIISIIIGFYYSNISYKNNIKLPWKLLLSCIILFFIYFTFNKGTTPFFIP